MMTIDEFVKLPGLRDAGEEAEQQIHRWLAEIQAIGHLGNLEEIVRAAETVWNAPHADHFTTHDRLHSGRIVARLADWLAANRKDALEPLETFLLIGAAYLHDVGLQCVCPTFLRAAGIALPAEPISRPESALVAEIRRQHPLLSEKMIRDAGKEPTTREYPQFRLQAQPFFQEAQFMAQIARYHCGSVFAVPPTLQSVKHPVRMMLLIHLLRVGDALVADVRRLNSVFLGRRPFARLPAQEQLHTLQHAYTASVERHGLGHFVFHYALPEDARDMIPAVQEATEKSMREHLRDAGAFLNEAGIALRAIESVIEKTDAICPYPLTAAARAGFRAAMDGAVVTTSRPDPTRYLTWLSANTAHIDIRGLAVGSGQAHRFPIEELYIPLTTTWGRERGPKSDSGPERLRRDEAAHPELQKALQVRTLAIVGDPGAGKSTFLNRITAALCDAWLGRDPAAAAQRLGLAERPLPVHIRVAEMAEYLARQHAGQPPPKDWLAEFLGECSGAWNWNLDAAYFRKHFEDGTAVLLIDGLDEAPSRAVREQISAQVQYTAGVYSRCRFVVTSRPAADVDTAVLAGFDQARIEPLTDSAVEKFFEKWSAALFHGSPERAQSHQAELVNALHGRPEIRKLTRNPVLLTALAVVHWNEKRIPEQRVDLYESILKWLARSREHKAGRLSDDLTLERLAELALAMQDAKGERLRQVSRHWAAERIAHHWYELPEPQQLPAAETFLTEAEVDSGIIVGRGPDVLFWHLTFQEYLAAGALAALDGEDRNHRLLRQPQKLYSSEWRETVLLFAMELRKHRGEKLAQGMVTSILDGLGPKPSLTDQARCAGLLGAIVRDLAVMKFAPKDARYATLLERVLAIFDWEKSKAVPIRDAIAAAAALGQAGDPRLEKFARQENWVQIEACEFTLGETNRTETLAAYALGRYPVTVQEYAEFVDAGGYVNNRWWSAGEHGKWAEPEEWPDQLEHPNRPVVGVNWFEACAYAQWSGGRLPTEAEWQRAAAGLEGRKYPWGDAAPNKRLANYNNNVGRPSPVGIYPGGATPEGIADLVGNVWEWCADKLLEGNALQVLRGGSWSDAPGDLLSSNRVGIRPSERVNFIGFRCVLGASSSR